jgi:hypothetical protein
MRKCTQGGISVSNRVVVTGSFVLQTTTELRLAPLPPPFAHLCGPVRGEYELWVVARVIDLDEPAPTVNVSFEDADVPALARARLVKAVDETLADRATGLVWQGTVPVSAIDALGNLPDDLQSGLSDWADKLVNGAGIPNPPVLSIGAVGTAVVLNPVLEPVTKAVHLVEVVGIIVGVLVGVPHLAMACAKHLLHDQIKAKLAEIISRTPAEIICRLRALSRTSTPLPHGEAISTHDATETHNPLGGLTAY